MRMFVCLCCRCRVPANPRVKEQKYCGKAACQRERKKRWQRIKMATDPEYRANQRDARQQWRESHPDYWRTYRRTAPSRPTPEQSVPVASAKMDTLPVNTIVQSGEYMLIPLVAGGAKMDALQVKIIPVSMH